jgi:hypothetical protein
MNVELTKDELALLCDGLAALPLVRSYNLFNKLAQLVNQPEAPSPAPPSPPDDPL